MDRTWTTILTEDAEFESGLRFAIMDATPLEVIQSAMTPTPPLLGRPSLCVYVFVSICLTFLLRKSNRKRY
jgi:hypothetical protein